jgi:hypothetical protein
MEAVISLEKSIMTYSLPPNGATTNYATACSRTLETDHVTSEEVRYEQDYCIYRSKG